MKQIAINTHLISAIWRPMRLVAVKAPIAALIAVLAAANMRVCFD